MTLPLVAWPRLALWKAKQAVSRRWFRIGRARLRWRAEAWERDWLLKWNDREAPALAWLGRPGGGSFWMGPDPLEWFRESCTPEDLDLAEQTAAGTFDLLASGPVVLGSPPRWRQDLYSGREWPAEPSEGITIVRGDGSDIRTVWELSRGYHLLALARAQASTGDDRFSRAFTDHLDSWLEQNPLGYGPHWLSPMDASIRAANWIVALHGFAHLPHIPAVWWSRILRNLFDTGLFIERHLEWHPVYRGNHFVSNALGLLYLGVLFRGTSDGERWARSGRRFLEREIEWQVGPDGVSFEGSIGYHRLVTEFFAYGAELMRLNGPPGIDSRYEDRLRRMYGFIDAYLPPSGEAPMLGDADDGRLHATSAQGWLMPRLHRCGLPERYWPDAPASPTAYPEGGFFILRGGSDHAIVRCGRVGINGAGSHDHNDQLSFELVMAGARIVADAGTFAYTRDLQARFAFRSTASHSVLQVGDLEQNPIRADRPWRVLADHTRARCTEWSIDEAHQTFVGVHSGFAGGAVTAVQRRLSLTSGKQFAVEDRAEGVGAERLSWRLHFDRYPVELDEETPGRFIVHLGSDPAVSLIVSCPTEMKAAVVQTEASDRYGERHLRPTLLLTGSVALPVTIRAVFSQVSAHSRGGAGETSIGTSTSESA